MFLISSRTLFNFLFFYLVLFLNSVLAILNTLPLHSNSRISLSGFTVRSFRILNGIGLNLFISEDWINALKYSMEKYAYVSLCLSSLIIIVIWFIIFCVEVVHIFSSILFFSTWYFIKLLQILRKCVCIGNKFYTKFVLYCIQQLLHVYQF